MLVSNQQGMTLPEILVVLVLIGASLSIVAPLSAEIVEKRQRKIELIELREYISHLQYRAAWQNKDLTVKFNGTKFTVSSGNGVPVEVKSFKEIEFVKQQLTIASSGMVSSCQVKLKNKRSIETEKLSEVLCQQGV